MPSTSIENYLKAIYHEQQGNKLPVATSSLANSLGISSAAITDMAKKLGDKGYLNYEKYKGISLTKSGKSIAVNVIRRHRLWELFLIEVLGLSWDEVHNEAENLEHHTSDFLLQKIDVYLGHPTVDPHGDPIPDIHGNLPDLPHSQLLSEGQIGQTYLVSRVDDKQDELMRYLTRIGVQLHTELTILEKLPFDNSILARIGKKDLLLTEKICHSLFIIAKPISK